MENKENVSVSLGSHNRDINENPFKVIVEGDKIVSISGKPREIIGCTWFEADGAFNGKLCTECLAYSCPDFYVCALDLPSDFVSVLDGLEPLYREVCDE